jgi:serine/tyrosine/threonine adenylyltransferase
MRLGFQHSYCALPGPFYARVIPAAVADPKVVVFNARLADELGLDPGVLESEAALTFSGNRLPEDADPIAMAYAGHQFGVFVPSLGDGRALLLGELRARDGRVLDVQLKGAGLTPFSRNGDGRAVLGPMLREYLISEAMHALGVPTSRSLAVVTTGEAVYRQGALPGAVLTRVAASHIRVGTFQYFAARGDSEALRQLLDYVIARHYPSARESAVPALAVLQEVIRRQARLIADWMRLGFIHGVMNTDNMAVSGETLDYGPCAFMDEYDPKTVFSSIDHGGRYAYANQPAIAQWNLARFAETLLPLIDSDTDKAVAMASAALESFSAQFETLFLTALTAKVGLSTAMEGDVELIRQLLATMQRSRADLTLTFRQLATVAEHPAEVAPLRQLFNGDAGLDEWLSQWRQRLTQDPQTAAERARSMRATNPAFIPRNHRVQAALDAAERGDYQPFEKLLAILQRPYDDQPEFSEYLRPPQSAERVLQTFCGT